MIKRFLALFLLGATLPLLCFCGVTPDADGTGKKSPDASPTPTENKESSEGRSTPEKTPTPTETPVETPTESAPTASESTATPTETPTVSPSTVTPTPTPTPTPAETPTPTPEEPRKTPIMGWASWNAYRTDISEEIILSQASKLVELGLSDLGYIFVNVDDGWQNGRGDDGLVITAETKFPSGMDHLAEVIHALGLKAGIYTDAGAKTCGWISDNQVNNYNVGLLGHEYEDLHRYLDEWGYDFIKVDWCGGVQAGLDRQARYTMIGKVVKRIEEETGKDKIYNVCSWSFPGEWVVKVADSWRTGGDIFNNFGAVLEQLDNIKSLAKYNGPGHVNDLDMMQIGNGMSYEEDKSHFAMWCMMSTPLMLGMDLNSISAETLSIISNAELIALDQDPACIQATPVRSYGSVEAWVKDLGAAGSDTKAFAFLNRDGNEATVTVDFEELGLANVLAVRDLWSHTDLSVDGKLRITLPAHGTAVFKASGTPVEIEKQDDLITQDDGSVVEFTCEVASKPKTWNLTAAGTFDWVHYGNATTRMAGSSCEIDMRYDGSFCTYGNAACSYSWTNGAGVERMAGDTSGNGVLGDRAYMLVSVPCNGNERTLKVAVGSYSADMKIELIVGGKTLFTKTVSGGNVTKVDRLVTATFRSDKKTTAYVKVSVVKNLGASQSVNVEGVALTINVTENAIGRIEKDAEKGKLTLKIAAACANEGAQLVAEAFENCAVSGVCSTAATRGAGIYTLTLDLRHDFAGKVQVYLQKDGEALTEKVEFDVNMASVGDYGIGMMTAKALIAQGAVLVDVRSASEYAAGHIEGAINLDYSEIALKAEQVLPDKDAKIIVYCSAAKRSSQATASLLKLGYTAVYNLGSMQNFYAEPTVTFAGADCKVVTAGEKLRVSCTASAGDMPEVYISAGENSTFADAVKEENFTVPACDGYYLTLKAYLAYEGVCYAKTSQRFIYWSEDTALAFATKLKWTESTTGWGSIRKDRSVEGRPLTLAGKVFTHGIGTHANSNIRMNIPKGADKFLAVAGCDEEVSGSYTMMFFVYIDGVLVDNSSLIKCGQHYVFDIDIPAGAKEILLYAFEGTYGGNTCDHADWAVAAFFDTTA